MTSSARGLGSVERRASWALLRTIGGALLALGCAVDAVDPQAETGGDDIRGYLRIAEKLGPSSERADALSVFVRFPDGAESPEVLSALGVDIRLPEVEPCEFGARASARPAQEPPLGLAPVDLVLADWVLLRFSTESGKQEEHVLSPRAFPTVGGTIGGAIYTSRTRRAEDLPAGVGYTLAVEGLPGENGSRSFAFHLPDTPRDVTVSGVGLSDVTELRGQRPLDVTWTPEDSKNESSERRIVIELGDSTHRVRCVFPETEGLGTISRELITNTARFTPPTSFSFRKLTRSRVRSPATPGTLDVLFEAEISQTVQVAP